MKDKPPRNAAVMRFFNEIGIIEQLARNRVERRLPYGLKISQFSVLNHFVRLQRVSSPARLAAAFQVTKGAMTNTLARLENLGFVEIRPDESDGRAKLVDITDAGVAAHGECIAAFAPDFVEFVEHIGIERVEAALPLLEEVRKYLDENRT